MLGPLPGMDFLGSTQLASAAATTGAITIDARDILVVCVRVTGYASGDIASFRFNGDTGSNYGWRQLSAAAGGTTLTNTQSTTSGDTLARLHPATSTLQRSTWHSITNLATKTKLGNNLAATSTGTIATLGAVEFGGYFEWMNTSAQITSITLLTAGGANLAANTGFAVWGRNL